MKKTKEKAKVGRPKLADTKTLKESFLVCMFIFVISAIIIVIGYNYIALSFSSKYSVGTVYNTHVKSCVVKKDAIDCGPAVTYMKYSLDGKNYTEVTKTSSSIKIKLDNTKNLKYCYKTNTSDLSCK